MIWQVVRIVLAFLFIVGGIGNIGDDIGAGIFGIVVGLAFGAWWYLVWQKRKKRKPQKCVPTADVTVTSPITKGNHSGAKEIYHPQSITYNSKRYGNAKGEIIDLDLDAIALAKRNFIAFDVETTGLNPRMDRIVELGAVHYIDGVAVNCFSSLVNPHYPISAGASSVNHITDSMLVNAPDEETVYESFVGFLGDAINGTVPVCAHNARFDLGFLCNTLSRLGYDAEIKCLDTLSLCRRFIKGLGNYRQETIEKHYGLINQSAHRAGSDAEMCGEILCRLLIVAEEKLEEEREQKRKYIESITPSKDELEVCAVLQKMLSDSGKDTTWLCFKKNSGGYVEASNSFYQFLKFRFSNKGKYLILKNPVNEIVTWLPKEPCSYSEGGTGFSRIYFTNPVDLKQFEVLVFKEYEDSYISTIEFVDIGSDTKKEARDWIKGLVTLSDKDVERIILAVEQKNYEPISSIILDPVIEREMVEVNAINDRCPLSQIRNYGDSEKGFQDGFGYYSLAEEARKDNRYNEAIEYYDRARFNGYDAPALYHGYATTYHKLKDYDNEIVIIEEYLSRNGYGKSGQFEARRLAAIKALYKEQETARVAQEKAMKKAIEKEKRFAEQIERSKSKETVQRGRPVIQMDDEGNTIAEYITLSLAAKTIGVSSKSIRDAATGVQKHAGGFCWKYKEENGQELEMSETIPDSIHAQSTENKEPSFDEQTG